MKIISIANERVPSEKANSINIVKMCSSLAALGAEVTLVVPDRKNTLDEDVFSYYSVPKNFTVQKISVPETLHLGKYGFLWNQLVFSLKVLQFCKKYVANTLRDPSSSAKTPQDDSFVSETVIFTRDIYSSLFLALLGFRVFHDLHGFPEKSHWFWKYVLKKMNGIICTNEWKMEQCAGKYGIAKEKMIIARNGFDNFLFKGETSPTVSTSLRRVNMASPTMRECIDQPSLDRLNLPTGKPIALYSGHLYDWKGAQVLAEAAEFMPEVNVVLVGGSTQEVADFTKKYKTCDNIYVLGHKPYTQVPHYLLAANVLVLPNSLASQSPRLVAYSQFDTSPIKMFEYMGSGRPIVASNLPAIREVLDESSAVFFETDNPKSLAEKVRWIIAHPEEANKMANVAKEKVQKFTWEKRAEKIFEFIQLSLPLSGGVGGGLSKHQNILI